MKKEKITFSEFLENDYAVIHCHTREEFDYLMDKLIARTPYNMYYNPMIMAQKVVCKTTE